MKQRNQTRGKLLSSITAAQTSVVLDDSYAPDINNPSVYGGDAFWTTSDANSKPTTTMPMLARIAQYSDNNSPDEASLVKSENIWITGITNDTLTVVRGAGRTTGINFNAGDWVEVNVPEEVLIAYLNVAMLAQNVYNTSFFKL